MELAYATFTADQTALWLSELGLPIDFHKLVQTHAAFFRAKERRGKLAKRLSPGDEEEHILMHMLAVAAGAESNLEAVLQALLDDLAAGKDPMDRLAPFGLDAVFWERMAREYGYQSDAPSLPDFILTLFEAAYHQGLGLPPPHQGSSLTRDAFVFLNRWKDSQRHGPAFETLSAQAAADLAIAEDLHNRSLTDLLDIDSFELVEKKIISDLVHGVSQRTLDLRAVTRVIQQRYASHWYARHQLLYHGIHAAAQFIDRLDHLHLDRHAMPDMAQGVRGYAETWFHLDQLYREFTHAAQTTHQHTLLAELQVQVDNLYANRFLHPLNQTWQRVLDDLEQWRIRELHGDYQHEFFATVVANKYLHRNRKLVVIISDALRYEAGEALARRIRQEDRYDASVQPLVTLLPSYTQLGMAALLPHRTLRIANDATVLVDDQPSAGLENRRKILAAHLAGQATALKADDLLNMTSEQGRALVRDHRLIYIYHNRIDAVGDKRDSEGRVFEAVEEALDELLRIVKKLAAANVNTMLITADHGFLYQNQELAPADFIDDKPQGEILKTDRRFILGRGLKPLPGFRHWTSSQLGLAGDVEMLIPKSIQRLRLSGSGSRYVHGGAALQEIIIPLITVHKKRASDVFQVDVEIIQGSSNIITTGQLTVIFYQRDPVSDKVRPRVLRAGIYAEDGTLLSDVHELRFDSASPDPRDREKPIRFLLSRQADAYNNQTILLKLEEPIPNTRRYKPYKSAIYRLRRSFTTDFDF